MRTTRFLHLLAARAAFTALMILFAVVTHSEPVPFRVVASGNFGFSWRVPPRECVFASAADFALYWTNSWRPPPDQMPPGATPEHFPVPSLPPVDWNTEMVIALSKGTSANEGHKIWVEGIERTQANLVVGVFHFLGKAGTDVVAIPFQCVATTRVGLPVTFRLRTELQLRLDALDQPPDSERLIIRWSNLGRRFSYVLECATSVTGPWSQMPYQTWPSTNISYNGVLPKASQRFIKFTVLETPGLEESCSTP